MGKRRIVLGWTLVLLGSLLLPAARAQETAEQGKRVVIWNEAYSVALSAETAGNYQAGVPVTWEQEVLQGYGEREIWTLTENTDGSVRLENGGEVLSLDAASGQLTRNGEYDSWQLLDLEDGTCRLKNRDMETYLTWYSAREVYAVSDRLLQQNVLRLSVLPSEPEETEGMETTGATQPSTADHPMETGQWQLYFGQLHAHTLDSDGTLTVEEMFAQASEGKGLDFFAVTDHSDSFEKDTEGTLTQDGGEISETWRRGKAAAEAVTDGDFVGLYGFEMSWNQGQGHMSTFCTPGWISRDREGYSDYQTGLEQYYQALLEVPESISQFHHPGTRYGDFKDFAYVSPEVDARISLIEVGSGTEGEYERSYDAYIRALDRGWHLAPTNNPNYHGAIPEDGGENRTVILAEELTEEGIYDAMRSRRVYATEDRDLQIYYTLNGCVMGSELSRTLVGDTVQVSVCLRDPTDSEWGTVEVVTTGGAVAAAADGAEQVEFTLPIPEDYYLIRVVQPDGDLAVTAPVWIRHRDDLGISDFTTETPLTCAGEVQTLLLKLYNQEAKAWNISSVQVKTEEGTVLAEQYAPFSLSQFEEKTLAFPVCFEVDGSYRLTAEITGGFSGNDTVIARELSLTVMPRAITGTVLIDGTHGGNTDYRELQNLGLAQQVSVHVEDQAITDHQLEVCRLLVIPQPGENLPDSFRVQVETYVNQGGQLLLLGGTGSCDELNHLLEQLGASMRLTSMDSGDRIDTGGIAPSLWTEGIAEGQLFVHADGCTLQVGEGNPLVTGPYGDVLLAEEGTILLSGSDFLADSWLEASEDGWAIPFANRTIAENLLGIQGEALQTASISQVRQGEPGRIYRMEAIVTAGTHNPNTTFPGTIYLQDDSGGIAAVGDVVHGLELGRRVRLIGVLEWEGKPVVRIHAMKVLEKEEPVSPLPVSQGLDYAAQGDQLVQLEGLVTMVESDGNAVRRFTLESESGDQTEVWIGTEITSGSLGRNELARFVRVGNRVSAIGLCHREQGETVLRVRDCDEVCLLWEPPEETSEPETIPTTAVTEPPAESTLPTEPPVETTLPTGLPTETTLPTEPPVETTLPTESPVETTLTTEPPVETTLTTEPSTETTLPTEPSTETTLLTEPPVETTLPTELPAETTLPTEPPTEVPKETEASQETTEAPETSLPEPSKDTNGNPPTGDRAFPYLQTAGLIIAWILLVVLPKPWKQQE